MNLSWPLETIVFSIFLRLFLNFQIIIVVDRGPLFYSLYLRDNKSMSLNQNEIILIITLDQIKLFIFVKINNCEVYTVFS